MEEVKEEDGGLNWGAEQHEASSSGEVLQLVLSCAC